MTHGRVLLVEDEDLLADCTQASLQALGYSAVGVCATGEAAVAVASKERPDVTLMDIQLTGELDGIMAAAELRHQLDLPVIFLTAHADPPTLARAKITEPFAYVLKPFDLRDLQVSIELTLYKQQALKRQTQTEAALRAALQEVARLEGVSLAARELAHLLNNVLAMPVGVIDLLQEHAAVPPHLRPLVDQAAASLTDATERIQQFQQGVRVATKDTIVGLALDLERSVRPSGAPSPPGLAADHPQGNGHSAP
jgi:CheY-like chemotaxis protein